MLPKLTLLDASRRPRPVAFDAMSASMRGLDVALGDVLRERREARGWSQQRLADEAKVAKSTVRNAERGRTRRGYHLDKIADALGVSMSELYSEAEERTASIFPDAGEFIASVMRQRGMSERDLAREMGVSIPDVQRLLDGNAGPVWWGAAAVVLDIDPRLIEAIVTGTRQDEEDQDSTGGEELAG